MDHRESGKVARSLEPLHALTYFAPETEERLVGLGCKPGRMCYFAGRAAPMGAVPAGVVAATFYNFNPELVARHVPEAWRRAEPSALVEARFAAVDEAMTRLLTEGRLGSPEVAEAAGLARRAAEACDTAGRALAAAHADLAWPQAAHLVLWHALSVLREHRGDGHVAVLLDAELSGLEALVTHTASGRGFVVPFAQASRGWSEEQWAAASAGLVERGLLGGDGALTEQGAALRKRLEVETDRLGHGPWAALGAERSARLADLGRPLVRELVAAGWAPVGIFAAG